jgi:hypothetical protein
VLGLFRPFEECVGPSSLSVGDLCFFVLLPSLLTFSSEFVYLTFVECDISTVKMNFFIKKTHCYILTGERKRK